MSNEVAAIPPTPEEIKHFAPITPVQYGWLKLSEDKTKLFDALGKAELEVQAKLLDIATVKELPVVQERIKAAKGITEENKARRMLFTNMLDEKLIQPAMAFEKRNLALIEDANKYELSLRKQEASKQTETQALATEEAKLKAHVVNEWNRIAVDYRTQLSTFINSQYIGALEQNPPVPVAEIEHLKDQIKGGLRLAELSKFVKFDRAKKADGTFVLSDEKAQEIFKTVPFYTPAADLEAAIKAVDERFVMYPQDLTNRLRAVEAVQKETETLQAAAEESKASDKAVNDLVALSTPPPLVMVNKAVVKRMNAIVEEDSEAWAIAIMQDFLKNFHNVKMKLKNRTWVKLSLAQMAAALSKLKDEEPKTNLNAIYQFKEIEK